ncbi:cupin domain-containing protein [Runella sp.]|uniref:cupin domain-containing protein n=1 Tax=Runella sp. TaxID=1960881 RepID=UPI003D0D77E4
MRDTITPLSVQNAEHYTWGNNCDGWHLLKSDSLSVIQERMPPHTAEQLHFHQKTQQVFYILSGIATFLIDGQTHRVGANESIHIPNQIPHQISNEQEMDLCFLVISEPKSHGDRVNLGS